jgi:tetratricopeptide (TPR) repeat protein
MNGENDNDLFRRFRCGETDRAETAEAVRAILLQPPPEAEEGGREPRPDPILYAGTLERALAAAAALDAEDRAERRRAEERLAALDALPAAERREAVEDDPRHHTWAFAELLRERSFSEGPEHPERSLELARLAVAVAGRVPEGAETEPLRADLRALAAGQLGNAERVAGDLRAAEAAFRAAREQLDRGTGDPLPHARMLSCLASLRSDQSRYDEAVETAKRAAALYRRAGDRHGVGRTLIQLATFHAYRDEPERACRRLDEALTNLDPAAEPRLLFAAHHNRASYLERLGRLDEAAAELEEARTLARAALDRLRLDWLSGRIALARGEAEAGERALLAVRDAFVARGLAYETAQVSLELAALYAERGRIADQRRLAEEMVPLFAARDVHPEARAALTLYCDAARAETASAALIREVAGRVDHAKRLRRQPFRD